MFGLCLVLVVYLHNKNLETLMKSRNEFTTNEEYNEYLRIYFAGLAMQGILSSQTEMRSNGFSLTKEEIKYICEESVLLADGLLSQLETTQD